MDTSRLFGGAFLVTLSSLITACAGTIDVGTPDESTPDEPPETTVPAAVDQKYPGKGFIVHEWGTDTVVVGSDGSLQRGLHHEEEDLPPFVYDRIKAGMLEGSTSVEVKMETPVTYFYSDAPMKVSASVGFPKGVLTQWYPAAASFYPPIAAANSVMGLTEAGDPALDPDFPFGSATCAEKKSVVGNGLLDWGTIELLDRDATAEVPNAPLDAFTWSYAREVDSNLLRVNGVPGAYEAPQNERFLFYRGLGNFDLPVRVEAMPGGAILASNLLSDEVGAVFVLNVGAEKGAFTVASDGIGGAASLSMKTPQLDDGMAIDTFVEALGDAVTETLDAQGLYHDEAAAMVHTWKRQWFRTPGVRVLYLAPQAWTDASIPLAIQPEPEDVVRVMMIRVEVITPELEAVDVDAAAQLADSASAAQGKAHFVSLGRFAEPRLRRALSLLGEPAYGAATLDEIAVAKTAVSAGE